MWEDKSYFIALLIVQTFFSSYLSVNLEYAYEGGILLYILKSWRELILLVLLISTLSKMAKGYQLNSLKFFKFDLLIFTIVIHIFFVTYAIAFKGNSFFSAINESRFYFIGLYLIFFSIYNFDLTSLNFELIKRAVYLVIAINIFYASFNYFTFDGVYQTSWKYQFKLDREFIKLKESIWGFRLLGNDFVRDGNLRASGFFISTLEYAITLAFTFIIAFVSYLRSKKRAQMIEMLMMISCCVGIYTSQTRTAYGIVLLAIVLYLGFRYYRMKLWFLVAIPIFFTGFVFIAVTIRIPGLDEASSFGRILQYVEFINNFDVLGIGFGSSKRTSFDSFYLSIFTVFGILGIFYLSLIFYPLRMLHKQSKEVDRKLETREVLLISTFIFTLTNIFVFGVQYSIYSFQLFLLLLLNFLVLGQGPAILSTNR